MYLINVICGNKEKVMLIFSPDFFKSQISIVSNFPILYKVDCFIACPKIIIFTLFLFFKKLSKTC